MGAWGVYIAGWISTIIFIFSDAVKTIRKAPHPQLLDPQSHNRWDA